MIISASRRTDIPAFYSDWLMNRIRAGYCHVPNPYNAKQISEVSLRPEDVEVIVLWSKNPAPLLPHLAELDRRGHRYYFLYTLNDYPQELEPQVPALSKRLDTFKALADHVGPRRVIWRYDPILISNRTDFHHHEQRFALLAKALSDHTKRVIISIADFYRKTDRRLSALETGGYRFDKTPHEHSDFPDFLRRLQTVAEQCGMKMQSCAEDLAAAGIPVGACIDAELIHSLWRIEVPGKDPYQRSLCACSISKDIGINDTCLHGCPYCYATRNHNAARANYAHHSKDSTILVGPSPERKNAPKQLPLF